MQAGVISEATLHRWKKVLRKPGVSELRERQLRDENQKLKGLLT